MKVDKLDKESLRKEFAKNPSEYYKVALFDKEGFKRHTCKTCGKNFWSIKSTDSCGDSSHTQYTFFKENPKPIKYHEFWRNFADFFKKNGHAEVERYPVVSRWRQDLYFTIASIQDFQRIENGKMGFEYSANPLVVPQVCLRFSDIENVGVTGRHFTAFTMAGQQSFDYPKDKNGYWRDRTIELNFNYLTKVLGVKKEDLIYAEDVWAMGDFSEFGPCLESFANGAELVNSVFTQFEYVNGEIKELDGKVVDVGWGFERLMWFYTGFDSAYEAVFYDIIKALGGRINFTIDSKLFKRFSVVSGELDVTEKGGKSRELEVLRKAGISIEDYERKIKPAQALYAVLDHTRTLLFAITDGALPSNIGGGYNLRVILRRALSFMEEYGFAFDINEVAALEAKELGPLFPELSEKLDLFGRVVEIEKRRFEKSRENANKIIDGIITKGKKIDAKELRTLYESNGITPELIEAAAAKRNAKISMPESSYQDIVKGDFAAKEKARKVSIDTSGIAKTEQLYYKLAEESESRILRVQGNNIILDKTPFYPEGGGQEADQGTIAGFNVADVQKMGSVIVHIMEEDVEGKKGASVGATVKCVVDKERRRRLMVHHTSVHLMSAAARSVLGKHAWQEGTKKRFDKAHIDIAHYDKLTDEDVMKLEHFVNSNLFNGIKVTVKEMDRKDAEGKYGFEIYQGHGVPTQKMRMVLIDTKDGKFIDAEACGGLHVAGMEQAIGTVKIINTERISDGIDRIELAAGNAELDYAQAQQRILHQIAGKLNVSPGDLDAKLDALLSENKNARKEMDQMSHIVARLLAEQKVIVDALAQKNKQHEVDLTNNIYRNVSVHYNHDTLKAAFETILEKEKDLAIYCRTPENYIMCMVGSGSKSNAVEILKKHFPGFRGGGSPKFAEGKIV